MPQTWKTVRVFISSTLGDQSMDDGFIAQAETRVEKLGSSLGMRAAVFYFTPFLITVLVVGALLIQTIIGA